MFKRTVSIGKLLVTYAAAFADPTLISGGAATVETLGTAFDALKSQAPGLTELSKTLSAAFDKKLENSDIPKGEHDIYRAMLLDAGPHMSFVECGLKPEPILSGLKTALSQANYDEGQVNRFGDIISPLLATLCSDPRLTAAIQPQIMQKVLAQLEVLAKLNDKIDELVARTEEQARKFGVKEGMLIALAQRYAEGSADNFDGALSGLEAALEVARDATLRDAQGSNYEAAVDEIIARVNALNDDGDIDAADAALEAEIAARADELERKQAEHKRLLEKAIAQASYTRDAGKLADRALALIQLEAPGAEEQFKRLRDLHFERREEGVRFGAPFALEAAVGLALRCIDIAPTPQLRGKAQNDLGIVLRNQAQRTDGAAGEALFEQAIAAYHAALEVRTQADAPEKWAITQQNLAVTNRNLGYRIKGKEGRAHLAKSVVAYEQALSVRTREAMPNKWAMTTQNLAAALRSLATLSKTAEAQQLLARAVALYQDALTVRTKSANPEEWAMTTQNLAIALKEQAKRSAGSKAAVLFRQAQAAFEDALNIRTKGAYPHKWAMTQENLSILYRQWSEHACCTDPAAHLDQAHTHVEHALTVFHPEHSSYHHAKATRLRARIRAAQAAADQAPR